MVKKIKVENTIYKFFKPKFDKFICMDGILVLLKLQKEFLKTKLHAEQQFNNEKFKIWKVKKIEKKIFLTEIISLKL